MNVSYIYNVNKKLSQIWQISTFVKVWCMTVDIGKIFFNEKFIQNLGSKKRNKESNIFLRLLFQNEIYIKQIWNFWIFQHKIIHVVLVIFCMIEHQYFGFQVNYQNELLWTTQHVFSHDYFIHIWHVLGEILISWIQITRKFVLKNLHPCNHLVQNFKPLKFLYDFFFIKFTQQTRTCFVINKFFVYKKSKINLYDFIHSFLLLKNEDLFLKII
jgi:hypothetical protein